jgi:hypothetical protein
VESSPCGSHPRQSRHGPQSHLAAAGAQLKYTDLAIETALTLSLLLRLPLRQVEGFLRSLLELLNLSLEAPDHTTLPRRSKALDLKLAPSASHKPVHLIIDSTGLSLVGGGEWAAAKHGGGLSTRLDLCKNAVPCPCSAFAASVPSSGRNWGPKTAAGLGERQPWRST